MVRRFAHFGRAEGAAAPSASARTTPTVTVYDVADQKAALRKLAKLAREASVHPDIVHAARVITSDCPGRDDLCEVEAIFNAVKYGDYRVPALKNGMRYVSDPRYADFFISPSRALRECELGACADDCDGHAAFTCALLGAVGFETALRAWGRTEDEFVHVYTVVAVPKKNPTDVVGLDTTVHDSFVGWQPSPGFGFDEWVT